MVMIRCADPPVRRRRGLPRDGPRTDRAVRRRAARRACSLAWVGWQDAVALSGFSDLADRVRASWEDERNPATESERQDWEEMLVRSALDPTDKRAFEKRGNVPIDDPATALDQIIEPEFTSMVMP